MKKERKETTTMCQRPAIKRGIFFRAIISASRARGRLVQRNDDDDDDEDEDDSRNFEVVVAGVIVSTTKKVKIRAPSILWETRRGPRRFFQRERARYTIAAELLADRARVKRAEQLLRLWPQSASRLLHRHWVKGEQNREIIDFHFLRSLSLPLSPSLSFFLTLFRSLSFAFHPALSLSLSAQNRERFLSLSFNLVYSPTCWRRSPFNFVLP